MQSLVPGGVLVTLGCVTLLGLVADPIGFNRQLVELTLHKVRKLEIERHRLSAVSPALTPASGERRDAQRSFPHVVNRPDRRSGKRPHA